MASILKGMVLSQLNVSRDHKERGLEEERICFMEQKICTIFLAFSDPPDVS